jgi:hypothetical protein
MKVYAVIKETGETYVGRYEDLEAIFDTKTVALKMAKKLEQNGLRSESFKVWEMPLFKTVGGASRHLAKGWQGDEDYLVTEFGRYEDLEKLAGPVEMEDE